MFLPRTADGFSIFRTFKLQVKSFVIAAIDQVNGVRIYIITCLYWAMFQG